MNWHVVSVNSRMEIETAQRINSAGFNSYCPTWLKKIRRPNRGGVFFRSKIEPLFPSYIFIAEDAAFRKDEFETERLRLTVFHKVLLTDAQLAEVRLIEMKVASEMMKTKVAFKVDVGDVMQIIEGLMMGEPVEVERVDRGRLLVHRKLQKDARPFWISRASVGKAV